MRLGDAPGVGQRELADPAFVEAERAEQLAFVNCLMDRASFDALLDGDGPYRIRNRETGETIELTRADYDDLVRVHLCDWLEQVPRSSRWNYRRDAFRRMAARLGGVAQEAYERVYAQAPADSGEPVTDDWAPVREANPTRN